MELPDPLTGEVKDVQLGSPRRLKIIYDTNMGLTPEEFKKHRQQEGA